MRRREQAVAELRRHRQHLQALLLRHGRIWLGETSWTRAHLAWITGLTWQYPAHRILVEDHLAAITAARARRDRLTDAIEALLPDWHWAPVVSALQAMRGIALISAVSVVAAIGDDGAVTRHYAVGTEQRRTRARMPDGWKDVVRPSRSDLAQPGRVSKHARRPMQRILAQPRSVLRRHGVRASGGMRLRFSALRFLDLRHRSKSSRVRGWVISDHNIAQHTGYVSGK